MLYMFQKLVPGKVYETRASLLRVHQVPVDPAPLWQMPKFARNVRLFNFISLLYLELLL